MKTFTVTVGKKTPDHPFYNQGSKFGYIIEGVQGATLKLKRGRAYTFEIDTVGHPFYLTTDDTGGQGFPGSLMRKGGPGAIPTDKGMMTFKIPLNFPDRTFYQCGVHPKMGGHIVTSDAFGSDHLDHSNLNITNQKVTNPNVTNLNVTNLKVTNLKVTNQKVTNLNLIDPKIINTYDSPVIQVSERWTGLVSPTNLTYAPGDLDHYYISDQIGIIYRVTKSDNSIEPFLDIQSYIPPLQSAYDERGLLGMAFHPEFSQEGSNKGRFFIFYSSIISRSKENLSNPSGGFVQEFTKGFTKGFTQGFTQGFAQGFSKNNQDSYYNCLSEFRWDGDKVLTENEIVMIRILKKYPIHNGGKIAIQSQGEKNHSNYRVLLYLTVGDGGPQKDPENKGQRLDTLEGKILRIDITKPASYPHYYQIPPDNPFNGTQGIKPEIYAYGFRNSWGLCLSEVGIISTDAGFNDHEEINLIVSGGNYGWNIKEGTMITSWGSGKPTKDMIDPVYEYRTHQFPEFNFIPELSVIIGGHWMPGIGYIFGDYSGVIMVARPTNQQNKWERILIAQYSKKIRSFGMDGLGNIYVLSSDMDGPQGNTGTVSQILIS